MGSLIKWFYLALMPIVLANDYCSTCSDPTICRFTIKNPACGKKSQSGVSQAEAKQIVDLHNAYRAKIANGQETRGKPGPQPPAGNMRALVWDDKLAEVAQRWADQCTFRHDQCRNDPRFQVGQNIYLSSGFSTVNWVRAVNSWYNEVDYFNAEDINSFKPNPKTGRFTQIAWATTTHIGCGRTSFNAAYRPYSYRPQEFVLSAIPSRNNTAKNRIARHDKPGFFGGAIYDSSGAKGAITSSKRVFVNTESLEESSRPIGENFLNNYIGDTKLNNLGFFGGAIFNPTGTQGAITASSGELSESSELLSDNLPSSLFGNLFNNGIRKKNKFGFFGGATFNPEGAFGAITATSAGSGDTGSSNSNKPSRPTNGHFFSNVNGGSSNFLSSRGNHLTNTNYLNYPNYQTSGNGPYYPSYAEFLENYLRNYDLNSGSYSHFYGYNRMNMPAGSVEVDNEGLNYQKLINPWIPLYHNLNGKDHILICNYGPSGNLQGESLYIEGAECSECPIGTICNNGLCVTS